MELTERIKRDVKEINNYKIEIEEAIPGELLKYKEVYDLHSFAKEVEDENLDLFKPDCHKEVWVNKFFL